jgi:iron(III) transport system ATP-binding protein
MQGRTLFDENSFVPAHQRGIGFVPQEGALFPHLNVADNIAWGWTVPVMRSVSVLKR